MRVCRFAVATLVASLAVPTALATVSTLPAGLLFDDFRYATLADLRAQGWKLRTEKGHPGIEHAQWGPGTIDLVANPASPPGNDFLRLRATTDGTPDGTFQAQVCHTRKYLEGTFAARIRFSDEPVTGADGDVVVQTFYLVSPLKHDFDPQFSEVDWEYLPNGGWGDPATRLYGITWQTVRLDPWQAYNQAHQEFRSMAGWHTLMLQVKDGKTRHWIDGKPVAEHGGRNYPVVPMSLNFNLWFSPGGLLPVSKIPRVYELDVDWVVHVKDQSLSPAQIDSLVQTLRNGDQKAVDTVPANTPFLPSTCDF